MNASQLWNATAAEQKFVVTTSIVCEGCDEASFDWASFKSHLATFLLAVAKIDESDIFLTYTAGSDEVGLRVVAHSQPDAVQVANRFQEARANPGELEAAIGVSVISIAPPQVEDSMVMVTEDGQLLKEACATRLSRSCVGALYESVVGYVPFPALVVVSIFGGMLIGWFFLLGLLLLVLLLQACSEQRRPHVWLLLPPVLLQHSPAEPAQKVVDPAATRCCKLGSRRLWRFQLDTNVWWRYGKYWWRR